MLPTRRHTLALLGSAAFAPSLVAAQESFSLVATTGMIADAARQIGGVHIDIHALMGPGVDPHAYRQTRSDIVAMTRADLVLWHGLFLEAQMERFFEELSARGNVVAVAESLPRDLLRTHDDYADKFDPHVWMAPGLWAHVVTYIGTGLQTRRPDLADAFAENLAAHLAEINALQEYARTTMASVPKSRRVLVTAHDAFNYFGAAYGVEVLGIQGMSTQSEAGLNRVIELVDTLVSREIGAVFVESSVSDRNMRALVEGAASRGHDVKIGGQLFSDAMGQAGTYEGTYIGMIDHNVTTIARALGGDAPQAGMQGKLAL
ncbi:MAG: zinc ABC transporter substrate-binding protein [Paracoccaceae bacterium]